MKKNEKLLDAIGNIDDYMIDAAYNKEKNKKSLSGVFEAIGAVAAVAAIAVFAVVLSQYAKKDQNIAGTDTVTGDETVTTKVEDKIIEGIKDDNVELINIKDIKEISGDYHWSSEGAEQWQNAAGGMTLHEILSSDIVAYNLPSLMPKGYILSHTGMDGSYNNIENCRSLHMTFIDNTNNVVEESRSEDGAVIYNKFEYNSLSLTLLNKSQNEGSEYIDFITDKYLITGTLSAANIYRDFHTEYPDGHTEYEFLIETDDYYILYAYNGSEGGERDLNCKNLYRIAASTPYFKNNGYKYNDNVVKESDYDKFNTSYYTYEEGDYRFYLTTVTPSDEHFFFECELKVTNISDKEISLYKLGEYDSFFDFNCNITIGEYRQILNYKGTADKSKTKITLAPNQSYSEHLTLITPVSEKLTRKYIQAPHNFDVRSVVTVYPYDRISGLFTYEIMSAKGYEFIRDKDGHELVFMTAQELQNVTNIHVTSEPGSYDFSFNGADEVKPITDYLSSLHPLSVNNNLINDYDGGAWVIELTYGDGTAKTVYQIANKYMSKGNGVLYELDIEEASKFDRIVKGTALPGDFNFFIVWDTYGISSYDSKTGDLIKENDASDVSKYTTTYKLTDAELERAYRALAIIDDLPDEYDPYNAPDSENKISSKPSQTIMVTVTKNGKPKTVTCENVCLSGEGYDDNAKTFLLAVDVIKNILTNTKAWQKLPDYEFYYD